jgi:hypothetical protein
LAAAENVAPLSALAGGWPVMTRAAAAPGVNAIALDDVGVNGADEKLSE